VASGQGARFPAVPFNATIYNATDYADAADAYHAGHAEVVRVTAISTDTLTITRAQESTTAVNLNTGGKTYRIVAGLTAKILTDIGYTVIQIACSDSSTAITAGTGKVTFRMPHAMTLTAVRASAATAPTGSTIIIDINEGGSSILSTKLSIDTSEKTSTTAASAAVISDSALADDAEITIDFDQVGSSTAGAGIVVTLIGTR
jgi:hypothetical protein